MKLVTWWLVVSRWKAFYWDRDHSTNTDLQGMKNQGQTLTCVKAFHRFLNIWLCLGTWNLERIRNNIRIANSCVSISKRLFWKKAYLKTQICRKRTCVKTFHRFLIVWNSEYCVSCAIESAYMCLCLCLNWACLNSATGLFQTVSSHSSLCALPRRPHLATYSAQCRSYYSHTNLTGRALKQKGKELMRVLLCTSITFTLRYANQPTKFFEIELTLAYNLKAF